MTDASRIQIFFDCPYGGCEDGYCACLEQDLDDDGTPLPDPDDVYDLLDDDEPYSTVRRYCPVCGQVVDADEANPDHVPGHSRFGNRGLARCSGSDTRQRLEAAP